MLLCMGSIGFQRDTGSVSEQDVEVIRGILEAFIAGVERGDFGAAWVTGAVAAQMEWIPAAEMAEQRSFRGREDFVEFMRGWTEDFEEYSVHVERLIDAAITESSASLTKPAWEGEAVCLSGRTTPSSMTWRMASSFECRSISTAKKP